jgi:hypothetical protein
MYFNSKHFSMEKVLQQAALTLIKMKTIASPSQLNISLAQSAMLLVSVMAAAMFKIAKSEKWQLRLLVFQEEFLAI